MGTYPLYTEVLMRNASVTMRSALLDTRASECMHGLVAGIEASLPDVKELGVNENGGGISHQPS